MHQSDLPRQSILRKSDSADSGINVRIQRILNGNKKGAKNGNKKALRTPPGMAGMAGMAGILGQLQKRSI